VYAHLHACLLDDLPLHHDAIRTYFNKFLEQKPLTVSYFADQSDKELIKSLTMKDGRVFADGEPLPKFGQADPDFKGDKWIPRVPPKTN
jgi:hypothetical protein